MCWALSVIRLNVPMTNDQPVSKIRQCSIQFVSAKVQSQNAHSADLKVFHVLNMLSFYFVCLFLCFAFKENQYIYIYIYVCICVCVCLWRERERER